MSPMTLTHVTLPTCIWWGVRSAALHALLRGLEQPSSPERVSSRKAFFGLATDTSFNCPRSSGVHVPVRMFFCFLGDGPYPLVLLNTVSQCFVGRKAWCIWCTQSY